ncbi:MAG: response regulator, partial [Phycisphaerae bacterium]
MPIRVLIVEDENLIRWSLRHKFEHQGYEVTEAERGNEGIEQLRSNLFDLVMLDHKLPDISGLEILRELRKTDQDVVVIMMTAYSRIEDAVEAIKLGAFDYVSKPFEMDLLLLTVEKALETTRLRREVRELRRHLQHEYGFDRVIGEHQSMRKLFDIVNNVSKSGATTVFLRGETGTGKDLIARVIHYNSDRAPKPFMNVT